MRYYEYRQMRKQAKEVLGIPKMNISGIRNRKPNLNMNNRLNSSNGNNIALKSKSVRKRPSTNQRMRNDMQDMVKGSPFHERLLRNSGF